jgi:DNA repair protein RecN (Recombination protein N)
MLRHLRLRDIVLIEEAELDFDSGFNVLSGETGAGKSILLDALGLAIGNRADAQLVRAGALRAEVSAEFEISAAVDHWLSEHELSGDAGTLWLRRVVEADGRSRAFVNGHPVPAALLRELGEQVLAIHGQHAHQSLLRSNAQRAMLDDFAGNDEQVQQVANAWRLWQSAEATLGNARAAGDQIQRERDQLAWQIEELAGLNMATDEWAELEIEQKRLAHAAALLEGARSSSAALREDDQAIGVAIERLAQRLRPLCGIDRALAPALELLETAAIATAEAADILNRYAERIDLDPDRLDQVDRRMGAIHQTARKLRMAPETIPSVLSALQERLSELDDAVDVAGLERTARAAHLRYLETARELHHTREQAAARLAAAVTAAIAGLGMAGSRLAITVEESDPGPWGIDRIDYHIAGHADSPPRLLSKIASGGELSRIGLAIAVAAAHAQPTGTLVFDEADSGVSGAVAELIGRLMRKLGESRQVLCVTHLPQVAARAHHHFQVSKGSTTGPPMTSVRALDDSQRIEEIARMLGGVAITSTTRSHARELLAP